MDRKHLLAIGSAFFVTFLWSSSWVLIKWGLEEIEPLIFAGIRYVLASCILLTVVLLSPSHRGELRNLSKSWWLHLFFYGLVFYTITQGTQFLALNYLPAITVSFVLNLTTVIVLILSIPFLHEIPSKLQIFLVILGLGGVILYFFPLDPVNSALIGLIAVGIGVVANALAAIIGRALNQSQSVSPLVITAISMTIGSFLLFIGALITEGLPNLSIRIVFIIVWLAVINTALAFFIWNTALQYLHAVEASIINSTMLPQITILAIVFFGETLSNQQWIGLILIFVVALVLPLQRSRSLIDQPDNNY